MILLIESCKERDDILPEKGYILKKFGLAVRTITDCLAEILQHSNGISESPGDGKEVLCLVKIIIRSNPYDRISKVRLDDHVCC